eukprot:s3438_g9.t1
MCYIAGRTWTPGRLGLHDQHGPSLSILSVKWLSTTRINATRNFFSSTGVTSADDEDVLMVEMRSILTQQREVALQVLLQSFPNRAVAKYLRISGVSLGECLSAASCCCTDSTDAQKGVI